MEKSIEANISSFNKAGLEDPRLNYATKEFLGDKRQYVRDIIERINEWDLWSLIDKPGEMKQQYRMRRRTMFEMDELEILAKKSSAGALPKNALGEKVIPTQFVNYPLPGTIFFKQGVNRDWLIDRELRDVFVFALENTNVDPSTEKKHAVKDEKQMDKLYADRSVEVDMEGGTGISNLKLGPGCAVAIPFCGDDSTPRGSMPDMKGNSCTRLVRFDPANPKHNRRLRATGPHQRATNYLLPDNGEASE